MNFFPSAEHDLTIPSTNSIGLAAKLSIASPKSPLIVLIHGFAGDKNEKGLFQEASSYFVQHGFSVARFDFRGCGESLGCSFRQVRLKDLQVDLRNVIAFLRTHQSVNPSSMGVVGFSLGAAISILCSPRQVNAYAYWSPAIFTANDMYPRYQIPEVQREIREKGYFIKAGLEVSPEFISDLAQNDIEHHIRTMKARVLLIHGDMDNRIPVSSSRQAYKLFRHAELRVVPGADHSFRSAPCLRKRMFLETLEWFHKHLTFEKHLPTREQHVLSKSLFEVVV